jgi:acyl carrier protein
VTGLRTVGDVVTYLQQLAASNPEAAEAIRAQFDNRAERRKDRKNNLEGSRG